MLLHKILTIFVEYVLYGLVKNFFVKAVNSSESRDFLRYQQSFPVICANSSFIHDKEKLVVCKRR